MAFGRLTFHRILKNIYVCVHYMCMQDRIDRCMCAIVHARIFVCVCITSKQHLRLYQDGYRVVTVRIHDDFIVLPHWETRPPAPWPDITLSCHWANSILIMPSTWLGSDKYQFDKSLIWLDHGFELTISRTRDPCSIDSTTSPVDQRTSSMC